MARITLPFDPASLPAILGSTKTFGPLFPFTSPIDGDFAWINQGGASISDMTGSLALSVPTSSGDNLRIRKKSAPATPYTIDIAFLWPAILVNYINAGIVWRQSSDGKCVTVCMDSQSTAGQRFAVHKWTNETTYSATYTQVNINSGYGVFFLRATDNGTNRVSSYSADGQNWTQLHSVGRTDFLTADQVGFYLDVNNTTYASVMTLLSWKQS